MRNAISIGILAHYLIGTLFYSYRNDRAGLLRIVLAVCQPMVNREITHNKITGTRNLFALHDKLSWMKQRYISVVMENANPRELVKQAETVWNRYFPDSSYDYFFLDQFFDQQYRQDEVFGLIVALFAILAIFISCMGLWVLVMFSCSTRVREMGIRKVLGASKIQLFYELGREFFVLIGIAIVIALPLSWWVMDGWLSNYSFRTGWKAWFFLVPVILLCVISLLTIGWQTAKTIHARLTLSITSNINFFKAESKGFLYAEAREVFSHKRLANCEVNITNEAGELIATFSGSGYRKDTELPFAPIE